MTNVGIIIQARSNSKRLPNKIFAKIGSLSTLEHVINRVKKTKFKKKIIVASTTKKIDKRILKITKKTKCDIFFGPENDVLKRFYLAAKKFKIKYIMRISADSPFIDPNILEKSFNLFCNGNYDIVTNVFPPTFPKGMSVELINFQTLEKIFKLAKSKSEKEHVTKYIYQNYNHFKIRNIQRKKSLRKFNFALDTVKDLYKIQDIYLKLKKKKILQKFRINDLLKL